ncbi:MAG: 16S rRNA (guanine(527)-N(7))-methyltransferase RsmG [Anaerolineae bacterium]
MGISLSAAQLQQFETYYRTLIDWNRKINLTGITARDEVITKHFLDSLSCLQAIPTLPQRVVDVGSGPGLPGLALKIARPHIQLTLVEATGKKVAFLQQVLSLLALNDITVLHSRAETAGRDPAHRAQYQLAVARAVAPLRVLAEYMLPLLQVRGLMLAQKGTDPSVEVAAAANALGILGGRHRQTLPVSVPNLNAARHLVLIEKTRPTPRAYPRKPGLPAKKPIM